MQYRISPLKHALDNVLNLLGIGPRRSRFSAARDPESRVRFARYLSRIQPALEENQTRRASRLLGSGGAMSRGLVRHAPESDGPLSVRRPLFNTVTHPDFVAVRRRERALDQSSTPLKAILDALRVR